MSLLDTKTGFTTPWHCSVALMADGQWISATMGDFKKDPMMEIIYENGRPCYFQEKMSGSDELMDGEKSAKNQEASKPLNGHSTGCVSSARAAIEEPLEIVEQKLQPQQSTTASSCLDESEDEKVTTRAGTLSNKGVRNEKGELINPFLGSEQPLLNPNSDSFSAKARLETLMSITSRDPE